MNLNQVQPPDLVLEEGAPESPPQTPTPPATTGSVGPQRPSHSRNASNCSIETIKSAKSLTQEEIERSTTLPSMISNCIETFQQLFLKFVELKVLANPQEVAKCVSNLEQWGNLSGMAYEQRGKLTMHI